MKVKDATCVHQNLSTKKKKRGKASEGHCDMEMYGHAAGDKHLLHGTVWFYIMHPSLLKCTSCGNPSSALPQEHANKHYQTRSYR